MVWFFIYRAATTLASPLLPLYLRWRMQRGKESAARLRERTGHAGIARPGGALAWVHAASVGEANAALPLLQELRTRFPQLSLLLTTGTVTSATLMQARLPQEIIHQFAPIDTPAAVQRFLRHWRPNLALLVESELWPNLLHFTHASGCRVWLINARMSETSFQRWKLCRGLARHMLQCVERVFAQSEQAAEHFRALGAMEVECLGNLKYDSPPLPAEATALMTMETAMQGRLRWLAASIHPGEITAAAHTHIALRDRWADMLTLIVPRHPERGAEMRVACEAAGLSVAQRSRAETITPETDIYLADTLGELGLFYRLAPIALVGGSLVPHGGQNPLEAARLGAAVLVGPHTANFTEMADSLLAAQGALRVANAEALTQALTRAFTDAAWLAGMRARASAWATGRASVSEQLVARLCPTLEEALRVART